MCNLHICQTPDCKPHASTIKCPLHSLIDGLQLCYHVKKINIFLQSVNQYHFGNNHTVQTVAFCNDYYASYGLLFAIYQLVLCFLLPGFIMIGCYSKVISELWMSSKNMKYLTSNEISTSGTYRSQFNYFFFLYNT